MMCLEGLLRISEVEACNITGPHPADTPDKTQICVSIKITGCFDGDSRGVSDYNRHTTPFGQATAGGTSSLVFYRLWDFETWDFARLLVWHLYVCTHLTFSTRAHQQSCTRRTLNNFPAERSPSEACTEIDRVVFKRSGQAPERTDRSGGCTLMHTRWPWSQTELATCQVGCSAWERKVASHDLCSSCSSFCTKSRVVTLRPCNFTQTHCINQPYRGGRWHWQCSFGVHF